jgi:cell division inhibitor SepF
MVYLGLQDDDELDYEPYGDYAEAPRDVDEPPGRESGAERSRRAGAGAAAGAGARAGAGAAEHGARTGARSDSGTVRATREPGGEADPWRPAMRDEPGVPAPRPSVVRTIGPTTAARVHVVEPSGFGDAPEVGDRLKANQPVILNLQGVPRELQRRLIDFSSGLAYAVGGKMQRVNEQVFLLTPTDVEVSQEEKERLQARGLYQA